jgi:hypothetical protein
MIAANSRLVSQLQSHISTKFYGDTANYITRTPAAPDTFGALTYTETTTAIACSFTDKISQSGAENWKEFADVESVDCEIRFSAVTPSKGDAITLTGRFDSAFTDKRFYIVGIKDRGTFGYVCALKAVDL